MIVKVKSNIYWFFYLDENLLVSIVVHQKRCMAPCVHAHCWHCQDVRGQLQERLWHCNMQLCGKVRALQFSCCQRFINYIVAIFMVAFTNKYGEIIKCFDCLFLRFEADEAHIEIDGILRLQIFINVLEGTNHRRSLCIIEGCIIIVLLFSD